MTQDDVVSHLRRFVEQQFRMAEGLDDDEALLQSGLIDSLGVLELVSYAEREFGVTLEPDDLMPENFASITALAALVERKQRGR